MVEKLVSIYINAYNEEKFISDTIKSVLNQTYKNLEIIVVDDCSTDKTLEIVRSFDDPRIKIYKNDINMNIPYSCNKGISFAEGDYIAHIDADDIWYPDKLEKQISFLESNPEYGACFTWSDVIDADGNPANDLYPETKSVYAIKNMAQAEMFRYLIENSNHFSHSAFAAKVEIVKKLGYHDVSTLFLHDFDCWLRLLTICPVYVLQEPLSAVRKHNDNNSTMSEEKFISHDTEFVRIINNAVEICPDELFLNAFSDKLRLSGPHTHEETELEKAFFLIDGVLCLKKNPILGINKLSELLKSEKYIELAKNKFNFSLNDFYKMQRTRVYYDADKFDAAIKQCQDKYSQLELDYNEIKNNYNAKTAELSELSALCKERETEISRLKEDNAIADETIKHHTLLLQERMDVINQLTAELSVANSNYAEIRNSFFWRSTAPFRKVSQFVKDTASKNKNLIAILIFLKCLLTHGYKAAKAKYRIYKPAKKKNITNLHTISAERRKFERNYKFSKNVTFSVLVPLYNTPKQFLIEMIQSVQNQTYRKWELCLADGSDDEHSYVGEYCRKAAMHDKRIKYKKLEKNEGISENTNACIKMSTGNYIALFDHDDILHPSALFEVMKAICDQDAEYIYTDEATFLGDDLNDIITYHFKPDFAEDNLLANNYICHFSVFKSSLIDKVGAFRSKYDGSQDHDIILRLTGAASKVVHIPKLLYFWRSHKNSVAMDINSKTYAIEAGKSAVHDYLESKGYKTRVTSSPAFPTIYRIQYEIKGNPKVSIIIPNKNHIEDLKRCIESITKYSTYKKYEIVIIDNNSDDEKLFEYYDELAKNKNIRIIKYNHPFNYSAINNFAVSKASGDYLLFLNNDTKVISYNWIEEMLMYAQRKDVGAVGVKLYFGDDTVQHGGIILKLGDDRVAGHSHYRCERANLGYMGKMYYAQNVSAVTAACMMVRRDVFESVKGFDEELAVAYNDVDFCLKVRQLGKSIIFNPFCEMYHYESVSRGLDTNKENTERFLKEKDLFLKKWGDVLKKGDPYYNPNFSLDTSYGIEADKIRN